VFFEERLVRLRFRLPGSFHLFWREKKIFRRNEAYTTDNAPRWFRTFDSSAFPCRQASCVSGCVAVYSRSRGLNHKQLGWTFSLVGGRLQRKFGLTASYCDCSHYPRLIRLELVRWFGHVVYSQRAFWNNDLIFMLLYLQAWKRLIESRVQRPRIFDESLFFSTSSDEIVV